MKTRQLAEIRGAGFPGAAPQVVSANRRAGQPTSVLSPGTHKSGRPVYHIESIMPDMVLSHFVTNHVVSDDTFFQTFF
jgi:hypothetical protein